MFDDLFTSVVPRTNVRGSAVIVRRVVRYMCHHVLCVVIKPPVPGHRDIHLRGQSLGGPHVTNSYVTYIFLLYYISIYRGHRHRR